MGKCLTSPITRKMQIKITMTYHVIPLKVASIKKKKRSVGEDVEKRESLSMVGGNASKCSH
jgi:hypothetical protein